MKIRFSDAAMSEVQQALTVDVVPRVAPEMAFLFPKVVMLTDADGTQRIGMMCHHPGYPVANRFDPPMMQIFIKYRFGERHQRLMEWHGREWAIRRVRLLLRLLLRQLAREVAKVMPKGKA